MIFASFRWLYSNAHLKTEHLYRILSQQLHHVVILKLVSIEPKEEIQVVPAFPGNLKLLYEDREHMTLITLNLIFYESCCCIGKGIHLKMFMHDISKKKIDFHCKTDLKVHDNIWDLLLDSFKILRLN